MNDLVTWLRAQLDEDERAIRERGARPALRPYLEHEGDECEECRNLREHRDADDRVLRRELREVEAKRRILDLHTGDHGCATIMRGTVNGEPFEDVDSYDSVLACDACSTVRLLALRYADRPGYREEWRP